MTDQHAHHALYRPRDVFLVCYGHHNTLRQRRTGPVNVVGPIVGPVVISVPREGRQGKGVPARQLNGKDTRHVCTWSPKGDATWPCRG